MMSLFGFGAEVEVEVEVEVEKILNKVTTSNILFLKISEFIKEGVQNSVSANFG